jgi:hypothetical protein
VPFELGQPTKHRQEQPPVRRQASVTNNRSCDASWSTAMLCQVIQSAVGLAFALFIGLFRRCLFSRNTPPH